MYTARMQTEPKYFGLKHKPVCVSAKSTVRWNSFSRNTSKRNCKNATDEFCHLTISQLDEKFLKYRGRVVRRSHAAFTEQGCSASHMTSRQCSGCDFPEYQDVQVKQAKQYPHTPQSKWMKVPKLLKNPDSECPTLWMRPPKISMPVDMGKHRRTRGTT